MFVRESLFKVFRNIRETRTSVLKKNTDCGKDKSINEFRGIIFTVVPFYCRIKFRKNNPRVYLIGTAKKVSEVLSEDTQTFLLLL
jgi:hypothetical protein